MFLRPQTWHHKPCHSKFQIREFQGRGCSFCKIHQRIWKFCQNPAGNLARKWEFGSLLWFVSGLVSRIVLAAIFCVKPFECDKSEECEGNFFLAACASDSPSCSLRHPSKPANQESDWQQQESPRGSGAVITIGPIVITLHHVVFQNYFCLM